MKGKLYAILDTLAGEITGGLYIHKHDAAAVRFFSDVASLQESMVGKHIADYQLICLGSLSENNQILSEYTIVLTGSAWAAAQHQPE